MARYLRCKAGNKWIEGHIKSEVRSNDIVILRELAALHESQSDFYSMTYRQAWGRTKELRASYKDLAKKHKNYAKVLKRIAG